MEYFERVTPESVGIRSEGILSFLDDIERKGLELHSLMVIRHGKCCAAGWWAPYGPQYPHPLFSFSKSLTATAIGFAEQEGLLSLSERLADLFPEALPEEPSGNLREATIRHLLCMSCGQETESPDRGPDWIRSFFSHPFVHKPGEFYRYNTVGTNMLAAILKRRTGQDVTEFLRPRLFAPLGISQVFSYHLPDPDSVEMGGSGMKLVTEDMARFAYFLLQRGKWEGKQLLNEGWFDRAAAKQIETAGDSEGHIKEWANGYGYQCWMGSLPGSFRADGAYGQFGFVYPTLDMCVVTTAATEQTQSLVDSMMEYLIPAAGKEPLHGSASAGILQSRLGQLHLPALSSSRNPEMEQAVSSVVWTKDMDSPCSSMEVLIGGAGLYDMKDGELSGMAFSFHEDSLDWICYENGTEKKVAASMANTFALTKCEGRTYAASARWRSWNALELEIRPLDALSGVRLIFRFGKDTLTIDADDTLVAAAPLATLPRKTGPFYY